jgi:hypothetical protein
MHEIAEQILMSFVLKTFHQVILRDFLAPPKAIQLKCKNKGASVVTAQFLPPPRDSPVPSAQLGMVAGRRGVAVVIRDGVS